MKCKRDSDGRALDHHTLQTLRMQAVKAARKGMTVAAIGEAMGVAERSVFRWLASYASGGQQALLAKPIPGRPAKVSDEVLRWLAKVVREETPLQRKFPYGLWTLSIIAELLRRQFDLRLSLPTVSRVMKLLGFSVQRPLYQAWQQDAALVRQWEHETFPKIRAQAKTQGAEIYFADESGLRSDYHAGTTWAPVGETPVLEATGRRFGLNLISAISPRGELRFMVHEGTVTAAVFREFLQRLMHNAARPVFLIVDGHPTHRSKLIRDYVASLEGRLTLFTLPPYAPQLNPDEAVWSHVKRRVARGMVEDKDHLKRLAVAALRHLQRLPELVRGFFLQPECRYIVT